MWSNGDLQKKTFLRSIYIYIHLFLYIFLVNHTINNLFLLDLLSQEVLATVSSRTQVDKLYHKKHN